MNDKGEVKLWDYLGTNYLEFIQGINDDFLNMNSMNERDYGMKKDIEGLIKIIQVLVFNREAKISDYDDYEDFIQKLIYFKNILDINYDILL